MNFSRPWMFWLLNRSGLKHFSWLTTIRARLYLAFGFSAALTIVGSSISYYEFVAIGTTTHELVSRSLPATVVSLQLAEEASSLVSSAPRLMAAQTEKTQSEISTRLDKQEQKLAQDIDSLKALGLANISAINSGRDALFDRLRGLNQAVRERLQVTNERRALAASIRVAHEALLDALAPAIDDANFDLMTKGKQAGMDTRLNATLDSLRQLLEIQSESNLLAGFLTEASLENDPSRLEPLNDQINAAQRKIKTNLAAINDPALRKKLTELYDELGVVGADDGIIALRKFELERQQDADLAFENAQSEAAKMKQVVDELVEHQSQSAQSISEYASRQLQSGQIVLIALSVLAIVGAILVAWLYVGRNVIRRLAILSGAMRRIADGELNIEIHDHGDDEIAGMTRALLFFRQATADASSARQKEIEEAKKLEIATATRRFSHSKF